MFKKEGSYKKIIATCLIFCFAFANAFTIFSNISYAETKEIGKQNSENTSKNVNYDVKFIKSEESQGYEFEGTIDEENLALQLEVEVKKEGYLKNAKILIESENGLSFEIEKTENNEYKVEGNIISLSNLSADGKLKIVLPIKYKESEKIDNLNKKINAKLIGTYVDNSGKENNIVENVILKLVWNTNTEFNITSELTKYIPFESNESKGMILQTQVKSWIPEKNNFANKEELEIEAVKIDGYKIDKVVIANKSGETISENDWSLDETGKIKVKLEKSEEVIQSNNLLITYILSGDKEIEKPFKINSKINGSIFMFGTDEKSEYDLIAEYELNESMGNVISIEAESQEKLKLGNILTNSLSQENSYKTEYETTLKMDISSVDMVENLVIKDVEETFENEENLFEVTTSKTKQVSISKDNFENILGADGRIEIYNEKNEALAIISKDNYTAQIDTEKVKIKTTKPIKEGILVVSIKKEIIDTGYSYEQIKTFSNLNINFAGSYILSQGVENNIGNAKNSIDLEKPQTNSELTISRKTLSTISENKDVELNIKFNNNSEESDLYKNPQFNITFPEYVKNVEIKNIAIANSEEVFTIKEANINKDSNGRIALNIKIDGEQTSYNTNNITKGTNILINSNITLDLYAPSKTENIILEYINENATSYKNTAENGLGKEIAQVEIKAPVGMVSVNKTSNYEETGKTITSVEQGIVTDKIEIFDEEKIATMDIIVMNNNENTCNDIKILGRIPFKGNKDFETGKDLGTTIDTTLFGTISQNANNKVNANIYYSENEEATADLTDERNKWTTNANNIDAKSYLIVPNDYEMQAGEVLQYTYEYTIPANLEHNNSVFSSFETIYNNENDLMEKQEISTADAIGLTTGIGTQLSVETTTNIKEQSIKEYEKVKYIVKVENTGTDIAENVVVKTQIPQWATLAVHRNAGSVEEAKGWKLKADKEVTTKIDEIKPGETKKVEFYVQANKLPSIEEYYANTAGFTKNEDGTYSIKEAYIDENGEEKYETKTIENSPEVRLVCKSSITAEDLAKEISSIDDSIVVTKSNLVAEETVETEEAIARVNETIESKIKIKNNSNETMRNIKVTKVLPEGLNYSETYINGYEEDGVTAKKIKTTTYNKETREITWTIDELNSGRTILLVGKFVTAEMKDGVYKDTISTISNIEVNNEKYQAGQVDIEVGRPNLEITQSSNRTNQYVKVGDEIEYTFNVKNIGAVRAKDVSFKDELPEEVTIKKLEYKVDGVEVSKVVAKNEDATIYTNIVPNGNLEAKITAKVNDIQTKQKTIVNKANIEASEVSKLESNEISNVIERTAQISNNKENPTTSNKENTPNNNNSVKTTYEIKGVVWLEKEKNGQRDSQERKVPGIEVKLINSETGKQVEKTITSADGEYIFKNLQNGKYNVVFEYDTSKYGLTEYRKQGVREDVNSDVIAVPEENKVVAISDAITIKNGSVSNIDMGLVEATIFDLSLTKRITKVTVQNNKGTKTYEFENADLAKVDINGKNLNSSNVIVEYAITVKNEGELDGYAKKIVDYLPKELEFSTELNSSWYKGNDGNLYTEALSNKPISAGNSETIKLVLTKRMTESNTGIVNNQAEIAEDYNKAGITDKDSVAGNKEQKEDDMSSADLIIGVQTGNALIYFSIALTILLATITIAIAVHKSKIIYKIQAKVGKGV